MEKGKQVGWSTGRKINLRLITFWQRRTRGPLCVCEGVVKRVLKEANGIR